MKQYILLGSMFIALMTSSVFGIDFGATVPFSGVSNPASRFSYTINESIDVVFGLSSVVPARRTEELDVDLQLVLIKRCP